MNKIKIPTVNESPNELPTYKHTGDAGMDLRAWVGSNNHSFISGTVKSSDKDGNPVINIMPGGRCKIDTGIHIQLPDGVEAQIRPRSGMSLKQGLVVAIGTVDASYRGSIGIILINLSADTISIHEGDRIAQMVLNSFVCGQLEGTDTLDETERGEGGFGHSGIK